MRLGPLVRRLTVAGVVLIALDQIGLYALLGDDLFMGRPVAPFDPPLFSPAQLASRDRIDAFVETGQATAESHAFDAELGWCPPAGGGSGEFTYDWAGCRIAGAPLERTKAAGARRVVAIGCSMTHGEESPARETWCAKVDELLADVEIANLGVAAYGLDQALMRLRRDGFGLEPDEVWMGLLPEAGMRVTTLYRPALRHWSLSVAFKPRFGLDETAGLRRLPSPVDSLQAVSRLLHDQELFLVALGDGDPWVNRVPAAYAAQGSRWQHYSFVGRVGLSLLEATGRDLPAAYANPESELFRLLLAIGRAADHETRAAGAHFRFLILPGRFDLEYLRDHGRGYWDRLTEELVASGVDVVDLAPMLLETPFDQIFQPHGHYSAAGNALVAAELARRSRAGGSLTR